MKTILPDAPEIFNEHLRKLVQDSIEQGIEQGLVKTALNMISRGYTDEQITEITNLSIERIQDMRKTNQME